MMTMRATNGVPRSLLPRSDPDPWLLHDLGWTW